MRRHSASGTIVLCLGVVMLAALAHVWVHLQVLAVGYDISRETRAQHDLTESKQRLSLELRTRMDLAIVERAAREQLKMAPPDPRAIRVLAVRQTTPLAPSAVAAVQRAR